MNLDVFSVRIAETVCNMPYRSRKPPQIMLDALEPRRLFSTWGTIPQLVRQDVAATNHPTITGTGEAIAVIDTGIDYNHPNLGGGFGPGFKVEGGYDFVDEDNDPMDTYGHGTEVAGVIASSAFTFNGAQYQGVAPNCNLLALRVDAANDPVPDARIQEALQWVLDHQAQYNIVAVNISFGSGHYSSSHISIYSPQLAQLAQEGVLVVASAGNGGVSTPFGVEYPAADPNVYAVGAVDKFDVITEYTERGPNMDLLAPGDDVPTTSLGPDPFETDSGTSFSAPYVAGTIALMRQANPNLSVADEESILSAGGVTNIDGDTEFGAVTNLSFQRLDVENSIDLALDRMAGPLGSTGEVATNGYGNSLAYDSFGVLHMAYYDSIAHTLEYVTRGTDRDVSQPQPIDTSSDDVGGYVSLAVNTIGQPSVAYFDGTSGDLRYAHFDGQSWVVETVDAKGSVGLYPSLTFDANNEPVISYYAKTKGDLRVASFDGTQWNIQTVDSTGDVGRSTSITLDKSTNELAIAYEDSTHGRLKVARNPGSGWTKGLVDNSTLGVTQTSIAFDPATNQPAVSYYDIFNADLRYATFDGNSWTSNRLASKGATGLYSQLYFDTTNQANILYYNRRNNDVVHMTDAAATGWASTILQSTGGRYIAAAVDPTDSSVTYSWFEPGVAKLNVGDL